MGLLSKLLGGAVEKAAKDMLNSVAASDRKPSSIRTYGAGNTNESVQQPLTWESGESWGELMPAEENQYNFNGTYVQYFEDIFRMEFSQYRVEKEDDKSAVVFTFYMSGEKALVVEILSEKSVRYRLRRECEESNLPYLRFYHNHHGWWNTRAYVIKRVKTALGI